MAESTDHVVIFRLPGLRQVVAHRDVGRVDHGRVALSSAEFIEGGARAEE